MPRTRSHVSRFASRDLNPLQTVAYKQSTRAKTKLCDSYDKERTNLFRVIVMFAGVSCYSSQYLFSAYCHKNYSVKKNQKNSVGIKMNLTPKRSTIVM